MAIQEKDIVLRGLDKNGNAIIGKPITRLANIEADAETKENPADNDYIPIIDTNDNEQMKKTPVSAVRDINNQTPTYTKANSLAEMTSGEKISIAFGKIAKAISDLISHIADSVKHITAAERTSWNGKAEGVHTHSAATQSAAGFMSADDKKKLDGVAASANNYSLPLATASVRGGAKIGYTANGKNYPVQLSNEQMYVNVPWTDNNTTYSAMTGASASAAGTIGLVPAPAKGDQTKYLRADGTWQTPPDTNTVYTHPTTSVNKHIPSGGATGQILRWGSDGTAVWGADNNTTYSAMIGASASAAGTTGLVPAPAKGAQAKYLRGDGTWQTPPDTNTTYSAATQSAEGLMSADDKKKLDGVAAGANAYTHPSTSGNKHIPAGGSSGQILRWSADGTAVWGADNNTTYSAMTGASASADGAAGLVPKPTKGNQTKYLRADGTWQTPPDTNTTYSTMTAATASAAGVGGLVPAPAAGAQTKYLRGDGTWQTPPDTNTTYSNMTAATASAAGKAGLVPAPAAGKQTSFLRGDGTWVIPTNTTYSAATQSAAGLMSAADKQKLDSLTESVTASDDNVTVTEIIYNSSIIRLKIVVNNNIALNSAGSLYVGDLSIIGGNILTHIYGYMGSVSVAASYFKTATAVCCLFTNVGTGKTTISKGTYFI